MAFPRGEPATRTSRLLIIGEDLQKIFNHGHASRYRDAANSEEVSFGINELLMELMSGPSFVEYCEHKKIFTKAYQKTKGIFRVNELVVHSL